MKLKPVYILPILFALALAVSLLFMLPGEGEISLDGTPEPTASEETVETIDPTEAVTEEGGETVEDPTEEVTEAATEPQAEIFNLTFVGDCTLGSVAAGWNNPVGFVQTVGDNYAYPLANVRYFFENDDFTLANLEGPLTEGGTPAQKEFAFCGPTAYTAILTGVEAVSLANNHSMDYGYQGLADTKAALTAAGIAYGGREESFLYTTDSGLTIGVYCDDFAFDRAHIADSIAALREQGAEIVICAFHWGEERDYTPNQNEIDWAHVAIDAGADIVAGHHPHVIQPIEYYNGGVIMYSLANFCFGGNNWPSDADTILVQMQVVRDLDGTVSLGDMTVVPCSVSSMEGQNNFQPTPLDPGTEAYDRVIQKLSGTYQQ